MNDFVLDTKGIPEPKFQATVVSFVHDISRKKDPHGKNRIFLHGTSLLSGAV